MAWPAIFPITTATDLQDYELHAAIQWALYEREELTKNNNTIPLRTNVILASGIITSLTDNEDGTWTLTDSSLAPAPSGEPDVGYYWNGSRIFPHCCGPNHWVGLDCGTCPPEGMPYIPAFFDVLIQLTDGTEEWYRTQDPRPIIRGDIESSTSQSLTFRANVENFVQAGVIPANPETSLVGAHYHVMRTGGLFWADRDFNFSRFIQWPNDNEKFLGTAVAGKMYTNGKGFLTAIDANKYWTEGDPLADPATEDSWKDDDVLAYDTTGNLHRLVCTSNDRTTLFFGGLTAIPTVEEEAELTVDYTFHTSEKFSITFTGGRGFPGRQGFEPWWWYGGAHDAVIGHHPNDSLVPFGLNFAADSLQWRELESLLESSCEDPEAIRTENAPLDKDVWTHIQNMCTPADFCFSPHLHKSCIRGVQARIDALIGSGRFVQAKDSAGGVKSYNGEAEIRSYSHAQLYRDIGLDYDIGTIAVSSVTVGSTTTYTYFFESVFHETKVWFDAIKGGLRQAMGPAEADSTGKAVVLITTEEQPDLLGAAVLSSPGWPRNKPLEISRIYTDTFFVPSVEDDEVIFPPETEMDGDSKVCKVGVWHSREPSSGYKIFNQWGYAVEGVDNLENGMFVRHAGENWCDPGTGTTYEADSFSPDLPWWDHSNEGHRSPANHDKLKPHRYGRITASGKNYITDNTQDWWDEWFANSGEYRQETGVATGGSTTTLVTEDKYTDPDDMASCWFDPGRWNGAVFDGKPFKTFILEMDREEEDPEDPLATIIVTYKAPITNVTELDEGDAPVFHFETFEDSAGQPFEAEAGMVWRIREAPKANRFAGKRIRVYPIDGSAHYDIDITHSDKHTVFFAPRTAAPPVGSNYRIIEFFPGGVWKVQSSITTEQKAEGQWHKFVVTVPHPTDPEETIQKTWYLTQPAGADSRGATWRKDSRFNLPYLHQKEYGYFRTGDYHHGLLELCWKALNCLVWTKTGVSWTSRADPEVPEYNVKSVTVGGAYYAEIPCVHEIIPPEDFVCDEGNDELTCAGQLAQMQCVADKQMAQVEYLWANGLSGASSSCKAGYVPGWMTEEHWNNFFKSEQLNIKPHAYSVHQRHPQTDFTGTIAEAERAQGYALANPPHLIARKVEILIKAVIAPGDPDEQDGSVNPCAKMKLDSNGDTLYFRKWGTLGTSAATKDEVVSQLVGSIEDLPHWGEDIDMCAPGESPCTNGGPYDDDTYDNSMGNAWGFSYAGWYVGDEVGIVKWNVAGGMKYVNWTV